MARKKVNLAWIANDSARRATFRKRRKGLLKKVSDLSTLCGVEACVIVYGPYEPNLEVWPSLPEVHDLLSRFQNMPEMVKSKKMLNQEGFLKISIAKANERCQKLQMENRLNQVKLTMNLSLIGKGLDGVLSNNLGDLSWAVDEKSRHIRERMDYLKKRMTSSNERDPVPIQMPMQMHMQSLSAIQMQVPMQMHVHMQAQIGAGKIQGSEAERTDGQFDMLEAVQRYPWLMDMINHSHGGSYSDVDDVGLPYGETAAWPNTFFPG